MNEKESIVWGIHAGRSSEADAIFLKKNVVAIGWAAIGDLSKLKSDREVFKTRCFEAYPEGRPGALPVQAGQLFRFVNEMKPGDIIIYPSKTDRQVHLGRVEGAYKYSADISPDYIHTRGVKWVGAFPRTHFSQGALYEIGSALSFFQVKNYAEEFRAAAQGKAEPQVPALDDTVPHVAEEIEQSTEDFVLKQLAQDLKGHPFAQFVAHLLEVMGYTCRISKEGADGGVDIFAHKGELGFEPPIIKVQVKSSSDSVGDPTVKALCGNLSTNEHALFVTMGTYTPPAQKFALSRSNLRLIDGPQLVQLILNHYEDLDVQYKALIPLKRVYIPHISRQ